MVKKKRLLLILTIIFTLIPYVVSAQPPVKHVISSSIESDEDVVLDNLPLTPKIRASAVDKEGKQIPLHTKAKHKLIRKYVQDGETHYIGQTDLEVPVNIQNVTESGIAHLLSPTIAYANSGSGTDTVISTITQHETAYWEYVYGSTGDLRYYKWTGMTGYWTRGETRYYTHDAHFQTAAMGVKVEGGSLSHQLPAAIIILIFQVVAPTPRTLLAGGMENGQIGHIYTHLKAFRHNFMVRFTVHGVILLQ